MKKLISLALALCMMFVMTACNGGNENNENIDGSASQDVKIPLGDTGVKVVIPSELGFQAYESELNEFYGGAPSGEWRIIVNTDEKQEYTLAEYSELCAQANGAEKAEQDADGNYYFIYVNEISDEEVYKFYTAVREGEDKYYRIAFYCFEDDWDSYSEDFTEWAATIEVE